MDFASLGLTFAIVLGGFLALGLWLDSIWHTSPIFLFVGIVLGLVVAVISTVNIVRRHL
jgi:F0F1-type ATP synthase assembly protein I